ncbi:hypothetical protein [Streptomyces sp. NPDC002853]
MTIDSLAARILTLAADNLRPYATAQDWRGVEFDQCMTEGLRDIEISRARQSVLIPVARLSTVDGARALVATLIPPVAGTVAEYADRLYEAAAKCGARTTAVQSAA